MQESPCAPGRDQGQAEAAKRARSGAPIARTRARVRYAVPYFVSTVTRSPAAARSARRPRLHDDRVVGDDDWRSFVGQLDPVGEDARNIGREPHVDAACLARRLEALAILRLDAVEHVSPVGERHLDIRLLGARQRRLQALSPPPTTSTRCPRYCSASITGRRPWAIPLRDVELARRAPATDRQQHRAGMQDASRRFDPKAAALGSGCGPCGCRSRPSIPSA